MCKRATSKTDSPTQQWHWSPVSSGRRIRRRLAELVWEHHAADRAGCAPTVARHPSRDRPRLRRAPTLRQSKRGISHRCGSPRSRAVAAIGYSPGPRAIGHSCTRVCSDRTSRAVRVSRPAAGSSDREAARSVRRRRTAGGDGEFAVATEPGQALGDLGAPMVPDRRRRTQLPG